MNTYLHRAARAYLAALLAIDAPAGTAEVAAARQPPAEIIRRETGGSDYVRYIGDNKRGKLETAVVTMQKGNVTVELVGAVHVADPAYYKTLNQLFTSYDVLLFELVDGQRLRDQVEGAPGKASKRGTGSPGKLDDRLKNAAKKEEADDNPAFGLIRGMMLGLGSYFKLQYQTDGVDYHAKNFVHADVSMDEFVHLQADKGESFGTLIHKAMEAQLEIGSDREAEPKGSQLLLALLGDSSGLKVAIARQLAAADELVAAMEESEGSVIISERNAKALQVFDRQVAAGRRKLGVFYGAAHLADLEKRLEHKGYKRSGERWMSAWDIKPKADQKPLPVPPQQ